MAETFPLSILLRAIDRTVAPMRKIGRRLDALGGRARDVGRQMTTSLSLPIAAIGVGSIRALAEFEQGMSNVSTLLDTTKEDMGAMSDAVLALGERTPVALSDLTSALFDLRSSGAEASVAIERLEKSAQLAVAGLGTTAEAVGLSQAAINSFGLEGEEATRVYDLLFKTTKFGTTTISQLSQGFGGVASTVADAGIELDEYLAAVSALTTTGLPAAQAHTQLRAAIAGLTREGGDASEILGKLGANTFKELIAESGGLVGALGRIKGATDGNDKQLLKMLGSTEALSATLGLTGAVAGQFETTLASMRDGADDLTDAFGKQSATTSSSLKRLGNTFAAVGVQLGRVMVPVLEELGKILGSVADWLKTVDRGTLKWGVGIAAAVAVLGPLVAAGGALIGVLTALVSPIGIIVAGIAGFAFAAKEVVDHWHLVKDFFLDLWDGVTGAFERAWDKIRPIVDAVKRGARIVASVGDFLGGGSGETDSRDDLVEMLRSQGFSRSDAEVFADRRLGTSRAAASGGGAPPSPAPAQQARVTVDFRNAPPGTRVAADRSSDADLDLSMGFAAGAP